MNVRCDEQRMAALLAQHVGELRDRGRLPGALEADEREHRRRPLGLRERHGLAAEHPDEGVVDDLHDHLRAGDRLEDLLADGTLADGRDELADDLEVHVRFQQRDADVAQRLLQVRVAHPRAS